MGEKKLEIKFEDHNKIFAETKGDYWLTQLVCQSICLMNNVTESQLGQFTLQFDIASLRSRVTERLEHSYQEAVKEFCRGKRFRSTNDPYLKLLRSVSEQDSSIVDLTELANANADARGSINNIKEKRLSTLIESKPLCERYFYYNSETKHFAIEDPALFYYVKHLNWDELRKACGFRTGDHNFDFDFAISFAGENRTIARLIVDQLKTLDCSVFYDEHYEANYLGKTWNKQFTEIFSNQSRFVICLLDKHHRDKIWPTFERECFSHRVEDAAVIPIYLDETIFVGIPRDLIGIVFHPDEILEEDLENRVTDDIVFKIMSRLDEC